MKLKTKPKQKQESSSSEKPVTKVISGFQIGVDIAGIKAARKYGIPTEGAMPVGFLTLAGMKPKYKEWGAYEVPMGQRGRGYASRTEANVKLSDGTLRVAYDWYSPGELCTARYLNQYGKPVFNVSPWDCVDVKRRGMIVYNIVEWIRREKIRVLNVAGNADEELESFVIGLLSEVLERMGYKKL